MAVSDQPTILLADIGGTNCRFAVLGADGRIVADGSADELAELVTQEAVVKWREEGVAHAERTPEATRFVRELLTRPGAEITDLEVRRASLEDTYLAMVHRHETGERDERATTFEEVGA